ncbi:MAG: prepilin-type N-terminal cleavage/methylation domain-containing protein [bacterium]
MEHGRYPINRDAHYQTRIMGRGCSVTGRALPRNSGFTLLEMLLTVFLIGLAVGLVALNVERSADDIAKLEARRFAALVSHLQDEATLIGLPMGIEISKTDNRYRFWELDETWRLIDKVEVLRERTVPNPIVVELMLLQDQKDSNLTEDSQETQPEQSDEKPAAAPKNLVVVEPTGIVRPFIATFRGEQTLFTISLDNELNPIVSNESI